MDELEKKNDTMPLETEKKSEKRKKIKTKNPINVLGGDSRLKVTSDLLTEQNVIVEHVHEKGNMGNDGNGDSTEQNRMSTDKTQTEGKERDCNLKTRKKKKRKHEVHRKEIGNENVSTPNGKSKKVRFSGQVEFFPANGIENMRWKTEADDLVRGKRFTPEEDEIVKDAVLNYIEKHNLGEEGLAKLMNSRFHRAELKNCWKEIGCCIPYRPFVAIYYRAHILFERAEKREWTEEETEYIQKSYEKHGNNWKKVAEELGKHRIHVKDKWRRIKNSNTSNKGKWSREEYQSLYDLVNVNLQTKMFCEERKTKHGMLRDDIPWREVSDKLVTRSDMSCYQKWYGQLTSSLVAEDKWSNADDYRLISALYDLDAACVDDVDWEDVLEHRPGDICRKRWNQMVLHIGHHGSSPFSEQVEILSKRYCPELAETREAWDNKPRVP